MLAAMAILCPSCGEELVNSAHFCHHCGRPLQRLAPVEPIRKPETSLTSRNEYAPIWRRFVAAAIDMATVGTFVLPGVLAFFWLAEIVTGWVGMEPDDSRFFAGVAAVLLLLTGDWLYNAFMNSSQRCATYGKYLMGLKVTGLNGEEIGFGQATGRYFAKYISTFPLFAGFFVTPFTRRRQALHDMVAGTVVVKR
jgi:uncharacterized RDD family membrane protein YckC